MSDADASPDGDAASSDTGACHQGAEVPPEAEGKYDVVICGTDLIQSILSSALSRAGKKVLHCDGNEWYGGFDAVLHAGSTLESFIEGCERAARTSARGEDGAVEVADLLRLLPREKYGDLRMHSQSFVPSRESESDGAKEAAKADSPGDGIRDLSIEDEKNEEAADGNEVDDGAAADAPLTKEPTTGKEPAASSLEHGFCFDLNPSILYASGDAVEDLVKSGVADYLEFKSLKGLYLLMGEAKSHATRGGRRGHAGKGGGVATNNDNRVECGEKDTGGKLTSYRVPCSKSDVFRSKLLSPVDKRRLMKFLQLLSDYGVASQFGAQSSDDGSGGAETAEDDAAANNSDGISSGNTNAEDDVVSGINEHYLHRGRALSRPQNKATPSSSDLDSLMRCVHDRVSFSDFLTGVAKLPKKLSTVVVYALALAPFGYLERDGSGKVGDAVMEPPAQYSTKAGVDDLVRHLTALGRFGDTAFLVTMYGSGELSQAFCRSGAVYGSTYMLRRSPTAISLGKDESVRGIIISGEERIGGSEAIDTEDVADRTVPCEHVIVPSTMCPSKLRGAPTMRIYRRVSILQGKLMMDQVDDNNDADTEQRHAIIIPPGTGGLKNKSAIHGVAVDDSAFVAPRGKNYTVLHLTTSIGQEDDETPDELLVDAMSKAVDFLIASQSAQGRAEPLKEIRHISFSYSSVALNPEEEEGGNSGQIPGLHVCYRGGQSLTCDSAFREAKRIFQRICPDSDFHALAQKVEDAIVYREEHGSDDEKLVLESACTMIQPPKTEKPSADQVETEG